MLRCLILIGLILSAQAAAPAGEEFKVQVQQLVHQLDDPRLAQREAAETDLLRLGPGVLEFLPLPKEDLSAEVRLRTDRIRRSLQRAAANAVADASTISLQADAMPLSKILSAFQSQSGNVIVDFRRQFGQTADDPKLPVHCDKTPFWPALDRVLDRAGLAMYPYAKPKAIGVVAALGDKNSTPLGRASYSGPFRIEPIAIVARRSLGRADGTLVVTLEVVWEPRLQVITLMQRMADVQTIDDRGNPMPAADIKSQPEIPIGGQTPAVKLDLPFRLPPREAKAIANLKGKLLATLGGKTETFRFRNLADAKNIEQRIAGVALALERVDKAATGGRAEGSALQIRLHVRYDHAGDALASHRQWIFGNPAYLEGPDGRPIAYKSYETTAQGKNQLDISYLFHTALPLEQLAFVYQTPGTIIDKGFEYELKDIPLP
jgi:hypothetical protein